MKKIVSLATLLFLSFVTAVSAQAQAPLVLTVILYGDEVTLNTNLPPEQRFPYVLEKKIRTVGFNAKVEVMGKPAVTVADAGKDIAAMLGKAPDVVILQLGNSEMRGKADPNSVFASIISTAKALKEKGVYVIITSFAASADADVGYKKSVADTLKRASDGAEVTIYPYVLDGIIGNSELTLGDGYYPNGRGVAAMVDRIYPAVDVGLRWRLQVINQIRAQQSQAAR